MPALHERIAAVRAALPDAPVDALARFIAAGPEEHLYRTSPLRWADTAGVSDQVAVDLFVHAAHAGLFEMDWGIVCPGCGAFLKSAEGLLTLRLAHCPVCDIDLPPAADENVEVGFTVAPSVRAIRLHEPASLDIRRELGALYFSPSAVWASPLLGALQATTIDAGVVAPGSEVVVDVELSPGTCILLSPTTHRSLRLNVGSGPANVTLEQVDGNLLGGGTGIAAGRVQMTLRNRDLRPLSWILFPDPVPPPELRAMMPPLVLQRPLTGRHLLTTQSFRDLFRAASVPADGGLSFRALTVLFTDLRGSTALYEAEGDINAWGLVRAHFGVLKDAVRTRGGAVVKTIGDAVMASFADPREALSAAACMHRDVESLDSRLALKIGLHTGPCLAVELNDRLDYFGSTVNLAARVQNAAREREITCTDAVMQAAGVSELVAGWSPAREMAVLKGFDGMVPVTHLQPPIG